MAETKYPTSLTGAQIDAALSDMAARNSEAYATGKRNGQDVGSSDPTYHNNAKYYAENILNLTADATVDQVGSPSVDVTVTQGATAKNMSFAFHGISGGGGGTPVITIQASQILSEEPLTVQFTDAQYSILAANSVVDISIAEYGHDIRMQKVYESSSTMAFSFVFGELSKDRISCEMVLIGKTTKQGVFDMYECIGATWGKIEGTLSNQTDLQTVISGLNADIADKQDEHKTATATLTVAGWASSTQTVNVTGVTASNTVIVSPAPASLSAYGECGVYCSAQASGTLTFTCTDTPEFAITVNVVILD